MRAYSTTDNVETVIAEIEEQLDMNAQDCRVKVYPRDWKKNILHKKNLRPKENEHRHHYHRNKEYYSIIKSADVYRFYHGNEKCTVTVKKRIIE